MKHAYLIMAHHEFEVLQLLLNSIDDPRNDIYIHFDQKLDSLPQVEVKRANLIILDHRVDVRWGDLSQIQAEYTLWRASFQPNKYSYYHLISGVDLPLKSQDYIHNFFAQHQGREFIGFNSEDGLDQLIDRHVCRFHLFPKSLRETSGLGMIKKILRFIFLRTQYLLNLRRNKNICFKKGTQWVSVTESCIKLFLEHEQEVYQTYHHSFCSDEIYKQTLIWNSELKGNIFDLEHEGLGCQRAIGWRNGVLYDFNQEDESFLKQTNLLFARKFNSADMSFLKRIVTYQDGE